MPCLAVISVAARQGAYTGRTILAYGRKLVTAATLIADAPANWDVSEGWSEAPLVADTCGWSVCETDRECAALIRFVEKWNKGEIRVYAYRGEA